MVPNQFSAVGMPRIPGNVFDLGHEFKFSFDIGELMPVLNQDVLPGDVWNIQPENMLRLAPLVAPVMHRMNVTTHYYFVPYRLLWSGFEDFITGAEVLQAPYVVIDDVTSYPIGSIAECMGIPPVQMAAGKEMNISPFFLAAYRLIFDEFYRDQNVMPTPRFVPLVAGNNSTEYGPGGNWVNLFYRSIEHDYFSSALPWAQKGDPVTLPLTFQDNVPVLLNAIGVPGLFKEVDGDVITNPSAVNNEAGPSPFATSLDVNNNPAVYDPNGTLVVDIQAQAVTLETLRTAIVIQEFLERDARSGTRYTEKIQGQYGVKSSDARLQRPEYIGGARQVMAISEVLSTAQSSNNPADATQYVGQMAGHGISVGGGAPIRYRAEEFGCIIGIMSVLPETAYMQGVQRHWQKFDVYEDYAWPAFANLGEQAIYRHEIYLPSANPEQEWGYQQRYAQYKSQPSRVAGEFRSSLNYWHMAFDFQDEPTLSDTFLWASPDKYNRIFAVTDLEFDHIYARVVNNITVFRKLPRFGIPSFGSTSMGG